MPLKAITCLIESPVAIRSSFALRLLEGHPREDMVELYRQVLAMSYHSVGEKNQQRYRDIFNAIALPMITNEALGFFFNELSWHQKLRAHWRVRQLFRDPSLARAGFAIILLTSIEEKFHELAPELLAMTASSQPARRMLGVLGLQAAAPARLCEVTSSGDRLVRAVIAGGTTVADAT